MSKRAIKDTVRPLQRAQTQPRILYSVETPKTEFNVSSDILQDIQKKVSEASNLNGKFDALIFKVEKIEEEQTKISKTVGSIHTAIYDPDNGLFSRIATVKSTQAEGKAEIEKQLVEINSWKNQAEKVSIEAKLEEKQVQKKVDAQQNSLESIEKWKGNVNSLGKWTLAAVVGGALTIVFRAIYELLIVH